MKLLLVLKSMESNVFARKELHFKMDNAFLHVMAYLALKANASRNARLVLSLATETSVSALCMRMQRLYRI